MASSTTLSSPSLEHRNRSRSGILEEYGPGIHALDRELGIIVPAQVASDIVVEELKEEQKKAEKFAQWATSICIEMRRCSTKRGVSKSRTS